MKFFALAAFLLLGSASPAQYRARPELPPVPYRLAARLNFTGLADPIDNNISAGVEYPLNPNLSVIADLAYIEQSAYFNTIRRTSGYMLKPALRFYPSERHHAYIEAVGMYKRVNYHIADWLGRACVNDVPAYQEFTRFTYGKRVAGFNFQAGLQTDLTRDKLLRFEAYIGLGLRWRHQDVIGEERSCYNQTRSVYDINGTSGNSASTSFPAGMRLVYCIPYRQARSTDVDQ